MEYSLTDNTENLSGPLTISFDITNRCMLKCLHCYNRSGDDLIRDELSDEEVLAITRDLAKLKIYSFCFCGGEALLRYELVLKMCKILKQANTRLNIVSNGWLIDDEKVKRLKEAGMEHIQISIDGNNPETHDHMRGVQGAFDRAINAIEIINKYDITLSVAFCPTNFNIDQFPNLVERLAKYKNLNQIRTQPFMLLGRGSQNDISPNELQYRNLVKFINNHNKFGLIPKIEWGDPIDHLVRWGDLELKSNLYGDIKSNGDLTISTYMPIVVGNLKRHSYIDYWKAGLSKSWNIPIAKEIASMYSSISYLGSSESNIPKIFFDKNIEFDLIDDNVFENLDKYNLKQLLEED